MKQQRGPGAKAAEGTRGKRIIGQRVVLLWLRKNISATMNKQNNNVHIAGHSLEWAIGMALAALKPSVVRSLILADSTGIPMVSLPEVIWLMS